MSGRTRTIYVALLGFALLGFALAQDGIPGVPQEYQALTTLVIGWLAGYATLALTAICKLAFKTTGPTTVAVSGAMSLLAGFGFTAYAALEIRGESSWSAALLSALIGFIGANGTYISRIFSARSAIKKTADDSEKEAL